MKTKIVTTLVHVAAWMIFLSLPFIFRPKPIFPPGMEPPDQGNMFFHFLAFNVYLIALFYFHGYWMLNHLLLKKRWWIYSGILVILFIVFMFLREMLFVRIRHNGFGPSGEFELFRPERMDSMFLFMVIIVISGGIWIVRKWMMSERKTRQIESERMTMELSLLRSQINPHFLFNTLNSIYSLALVKSENTADAVMKLSDIMRYMTEDSNSDKVPLVKEVDYISHYVELQKIRLNDPSNVSLEVSGDLTGYMIPPLVLMPFVENAFKYGTRNNEPTMIRINLQIEDYYLIFNVLNIVINDRNHSSKAHVGISNTRKRLELIYPGRHSLEISDDNRLFTVRLSIRLT